MVRIQNKGPGTSYEVGKMVAETARYRLYLCRPEGATVDHLLQIASTTEYNGDLDRSAYILSRLLAEAEELEEGYAKVKKNPKHFVNYQLSFPEVIETFVSMDQGNRRVNILRFRGVDDVRNMVPLHNLVNKDQLKVDLKTSVWIMGKLLKVLAFAHGTKIVVGNMTLGNIIVEPDQHYVVIFNWADAHVMPDSVPESLVREEVQAAALAAVEVAGGNLQDGIPDDGSAEFPAYGAHLLRLARVGDGDALRTHKKFYELVDSIWPRGFHKFTTLPKR